MITLNVESISDILNNTNSNKNSRKSSNIKSIWYKTFPLSVLFEDSSICSNTDSSDNCVISNDDIRREDKVKVTPFETFLLRTYDILTNSHDNTKSQIKGIDTDISSSNKINDTTKEPSN